jgi:hypothetical protein
MTQLLLYSKRIITTVFDRVCTVLCVFLFCQIPLLMQQYEMRLSGHVAELEYFLNGLQNNAAQSHKTLSEYINKFLRQEDVDFSNQGRFLQETVQRERLLRSVLEQLQRASTVEKPFVFLKNLQMEVFDQTLSGFTFGLNLTLETLAYAIIGLLGWATLSSLFQLGELRLPRAPA